MIVRPIVRPLVRPVVNSVTDRISSSSSWTPLSIVSKVLFWGKVSEISGGQMPNKVTGATDFLTVAGSPYTFQTPNTAAYIAADTDYIWFRTDAFQRTVTTAELIGYDLQRTPVKYLDDAPNTIEEIVILKAGEVLTASERDEMFKYMHLPILWDNSLNIYGYVKSNRGASQVLWPVEVETVLHDTFTGADGTNLNAHQFDIGPAGWTVVSGAWTISTNRAVEATQAGAVYSIIAESGRANIDMSMDVLTLATTAKYQSDLLFRYQDSTHYWRLTLTRAVTAESIYLKLYLYSTEKASVVVTAELNTTYTMRVVANGNNIKGYFNGELLIDLDDATYNDKTKVGIGAYRAPAYPDTPRDNFIVKSAYV